jgi:hypothetical protein
MPERPWDLDRARQTSSPPGTMGARGRPESSSSLGRSR